MQKNNLTFEAFLAQDIPARELIDVLDETLFQLVTSLRTNDPIFTETIVRLYESLYLLREFIKKYV
jgi:hypothetical protein